MCHHFLRGPSVPQTEPLGPLFWNGSIEEKESGLVSIHGRSAAVSSPLEESREDPRIGIVWESVFTFRREIVKEDMPGDALVIKIIAIPIAGIL